MSGSALICCRPLCSESTRMLSFGLQRLCQPAAAMTLTISLDVGCRVQQNAL